MAIISVKISIHALREEGDSASWTSVRARYDFYPRPPRGGRQGCRRNQCRSGTISIHALLTEGDFAMLGHME